MRAPAGEVVAPRNRHRVGSQRPQGRGDHDRARSTQPIARGIDVDHRTAGGERVRQEVAPESRHGGRDHLARGSDRARAARRGAPPPASSPTVTASTAPLYPSEGLPASAAPGAGPPTAGSRDRGTHQRRGPGAERRGRDRPADALARDRGTSSSSSRSEPTSWRRSPGARGTAITRPPVRITVWSAGMSWTSPLMSGRTSRRASKTGGSDHVAASDRESARRRRPGRASRRRLELERLASGPALRDRRFRTAHRLVCDRGDRERRAAPLRRTPRSAASTIPARPQPAGLDDRIPERHDHAPPPEANPSAIAHRVASRGSGPRLARVRASCSRCGDRSAAHVVPRVVVEVVLDRSLAPAGHEQHPRFRPVRTPRRRTGRRACRRPAASPSAPTGSPAAAACPGPRRGRPRALSARPVIVVAPGLLRLRDVARRAGRR